MDVIGTTQRAARPEELEEMRRRLDEAMREGAFGLSSALIYPPGSYASTEEIVALARTAAIHGGRYVTHVRGEGDRIEIGASTKPIRVAKEADIPVVIYHLKVATRSRWKTHARHRRPDRAGASRWPRRVGDGLPISGGGDEPAARRCRTGCTMAARRRCCVGSADPSSVRGSGGTSSSGHDGWENFLRSAGFDGVTIADVKEGGDTSVIGLTLAEIARRRQQPEWDTFFDLLIAHEGRVAALYALMHEDDVREVLRQPWVTIGTDSSAQPAEGPLAVGRPHPRGFGSFPRVLGRYVRDEQLVPLAGDDPADDQRGGAIRWASASAVRCGRAGMPISSSSIRRASATRRRSTGRGSTLKAWMPSWSMAW